MGRRMCFLFCILQIVTRPTTSRHLLALSGVSLGWHVNRLGLVVGVPQNPVTISSKFACADSLSALRGVCRPERGYEIDAAVIGRPAVVSFSRPLIVVVGLCRPRAR